MVPMRTFGLRGRPGAVLFLALTMLLCTSCHAWFSFYIQNETDERHYVRVTVHRNGAVYVHEVDPRTSGYAGGHGPAVPWNEGDAYAYTVELLDEGCSPLAEWGMPSTGGYLEISEAPEFLPGELPPASPQDTGESGASESPDSFEHMTVLACGANDTLP
jgi:hypothetical protein